MDAGGEAAAVDLGTPKEGESVPGGRLEADDDRAEIGAAEMAMVEGGVGQSPIIGQNVPVAGDARLPPRSSKQIVHIQHGTKVAPALMVKGEFLKIPGRALVNKDGKLDDDKGFVRLLMDVDEPDLLHALGTDRESDEIKRVITSLEAVTLTDLAGPILINGGSPGFDTRVKPFFDEVASMARKKVFRNSLGETPEGKKRYANSVAAKYVRTVKGHVTGIVVERAIDLVSQAVQSGSLSPDVFITL